MCLAVPMRVLVTDGAFATCVGRQGEETIDVRLVGPVRPGDHVLAFLGAAREVVDAEEARRIDAALDALDATREGRPVDLAACFPDLAGREPELPAFLRGKEHA